MVNFIDCLCATAAAINDSNRPTLCFIPLETLQLYEIIVEKQNFIYAHCVTLLLLFVNFKYWQVRFRDSNKVPVRFYC